MYVLAWKTSVITGFTYAFTYQHLLTNEKCYQSLKKYLFLPLLWPKVLIILSISSFKTLLTFSLSMCKRARFESLSRPILFFKYVFNLLSDEKECSAEHKVAAIHKQTDIMNTACNKQTARPRQACLKFLSVLSYIIK